MGEPDIILFAKIVAEIESGVNRRDLLARRVGITDAELAEAVVRAQRACADAASCRRKTIVEEVDLPPDCEQHESRLVRIVGRTIRALAWVTAKRKEPPLHKDQLLLFSGNASPDR